MQLINLIQVISIIWNLIWRVKCLIVSEKQGTDHLIEGNNSNEIFPKKCDFVGINSNMRGTHGYYISWWRGTITHLIESYTVDQTDECEIYFTFKGLQSLDKPFTNNNI